MKRGLLLLGLVLVVALAWWLGSPLFLNRSVDEEFPFASKATVPADMTREAVERQMRDMAQTNVEANDAMPAAGEPETLKRGAFRDADSFHRGSGTATIYEVPGGELILRFENFRVTNGPDLRVLLSGHPSPEGHQDLDDAGYFELGRLKGNVGNQNYPIPPGTVIDDQRSVVIYCNPFRIVFSVAELKDGE